MNYFNSSLFFAITAIFLASNTGCGAGDSSDIATCSSEYIFIPKGDDAWLDNLITLNQDKSILVKQYKYDQDVLYAVNIYNDKQNILHIYNCSGKIIKTQENTTGFTKPIEITNGTFLKEILYFTDGEIQS